MQIHQETFALATQKRELVELTPEIEVILTKTKVKKGLCQIFLAHTSASLIFCENYDPTVLRDLEVFFSRLVPNGDPIFLHKSEGADDMPAHVRTVLTQNSLSLPIMDGKLVLGTWQGIFLWEHRTHAHKRHLIVTILGE